MSLPYSVYATPRPEAIFSKEYFTSLTVADADALVQRRGLPRTLPKNSIGGLCLFHTEEPVHPSEILLSANEPIPCLEDLLPITQAMEDAYHHEHARAVLVPFNGTVYTYHLSKVCS
jgi:hypothetical protein